MRKELGIFILLVLLCVVVAAINPRFLVGSNLQNISRLIGMFAIALYDKVTGELVLVRDRIGIKPLYWNAIGGNGANAS